MLYIIKLYHCYCSGIYFFFGYVDFTNFRGVLDCRLGLIVLLLKSKVHTLSSMLFFFTYLPILLVEKSLPDSCFALNYNIQKRNGTSIMMFFFSLNYVLLLCSHLSKIFQSFTSIRCLCYSGLIARRVEKWLKPRKEWKAIKKYFIFM